MFGKYKKWETQYGEIIKFKDMTDDQLSDCLISLNVTEHPEINDENLPTIHNDFIIKHIKQYRNEIIKEMYKRERKKPLTEIRVSVIEADDLLVCVDDNGIRYEIHDLDDVDAEVGNIITIAKIDGEYMTISNITKDTLS